MACENGQRRLVRFGDAHMRIKEKIFLHIENHLEPDIIATRRRAS